MTIKEKKNELKYCIAVAFLDELINEKLITEDEYDAIRTEIAMKIKSPIGLLEVTDKLWKRKK